MDINPDLTKSSKNIKPRINPSRAERRTIHLCRLRVMAKYHNVSADDEARIDMADEIERGIFEDKARIGSDKLLALLKEFHG